MIQNILIIDQRIIFKLAYFMVSGIICCKEHIMAVDRGGRACYIHPYMGIYFKLDLLAFAK